MKLIDILVKELPERLGHPTRWPLNADGAVQDVNGDVYFFSGDNPVFRHPGVWLVGFNSTWFVVGIHLSQPADDYATSIVTREQFEQAVLDRENSLQKRASDDALTSDVASESKHEVSAFRLSLELHKVSLLTGGVQSKLSWNAGALSAVMPGDAAEKAAMKGAMHDIQVAIADLKEALAILENSVAK